MPQTIEIPDGAEPVDLSFDVETPHRPFIMLAEFLGRNTVPPSMILDGLLTAAAMVAIGQRKPGVEPEAMIEEFAEQALGSVRDVAAFMADSERQRAKPN